MSSFAIQNIQKNWAKADNFKKELAEIGNKHLPFFNERNPVLDCYNHDDLNQHYVIIVDNHKIQFSFLRTPDVPMSIRKECEEAFKKCFRFEN